MPSERSACSPTDFTMLALMLASPLTRPPRPAPRPLAGRPPALQPTAGLHSVLLVVLQLRCARWSYSRAQTTLRSTAGTAPLRSAATPRRRLSISVVRRAAPSIFARRRFRFRRGRHVAPLAEASPSSPPDPLPPQPSSPPSPARVTATLAAAPYEAAFVRHPLARPPPLPLPPPAAPLPGDARSSTSGPMLSSTGGAVSELSIAAASRLAGAPAPSSSCSRCAFAGAAAAAAKARPWLKVARARSECVSCLVTCVLAISIPQYALAIHAWDARIRPHPIISSEAGGGAERAQPREAVGERRPFGAAVRLDGAA